MRQITQSDVVKRTAPDAPPAELRRLAARVRRLGVAGRRDPETVTVEKLIIAAELAQLARRLEAAA